MIVLPIKELSNHWAIWARAKYSWVKSTGVDLESRPTAAKCLTLFPYLDREPLAMESKIWDFRMSMNEKGEKVKEGVYGGNLVQNTGKLS